MLLFLLTITLLLGSITIANFTAAKNCDLRSSAPPFVLFNRQVSLWSLVLFLFFPTAKVPSEPVNAGSNLPASENF